jgi:hypothetical protein
MSHRYNDDFLLAFHYHGTLGQGKHGVRPEPMAAGRWMDLFLSQADLARRGGLDSLSLTRLEADPPTLTRRGFTRQAPAQPAGRRSGEQPASAGGRLV